MTDANTKTTLGGVDPKNSLGLDFKDDEPQPSTAVDLDALNQPLPEDIETPASELGSELAGIPGITVRGGIDATDIFQNPALGTGLIVQLPTGKTEALYGTIPFTATIAAWQAIVVLCSQHLSIPQNALLSKGSPRPTDKIVEAQTFLVHTLKRVAGDVEARAWLQHLGFSARWIKRKLAASLTPQQNLDLGKLNPQVMFRLTRDAASMP